MCVIHVLVPLYILSSVHQSIHTLLGSFIRSFIHSFVHFSVFQFIVFRCFISCHTTHAMSCHVMPFHFTLFRCIWLNLLVSSFTRLCTFMHALRIVLFCCVLCVTAANYCLRLFLSYAVLVLWFLFYSRVHAVVCFFCPQAAHFKSESLRCLPQSAGRLPKLMILASVCLTPGCRGAFDLKGPKSWTFWLKEPNAVEFLT